MAAELGGSDELGKELIRRNREIAEVRDQLLQTQDFLTEARARNTELLEKNSLNEAEKTRAEGKFAELEGRCRVLEAAKETATRQLVEERLKGDEATRDIREKFEQTQSNLQEVLTREEDLKDKAKLHADQVLVLESKLEAEGRNTADARLASSRAESALEEASRRAADAQLRVKELEAEVNEQGSRANEELQSKLQTEEAKRLQAEADIEIERTRGDILTKDLGDAKAEIKRLQAELEELRSKKEEETQARKQAEEHNAAEAMRRRLEEERLSVELGKQNADSAVELLEAKAARERAETEATQQREKALKWAAEADELRRRLQEDAGRLDEVRRGSDEVRKVLGDVQSRLQDAEARAEASAPRTKALEESLASQQLQCQALAKELNEVREEKERCMREMDQDSTTLQGLRASIASLEADLANARTAAETTKQHAAEEHKLNSECASLRDQLSATQSQLRQQSQAALEAEGLRGQLAEARRSTVEGGQAIREVEALQGRIAGLVAQVGEQETRAKELQKKCDSLEGAKLNADEEVARTKVKMTSMSTDINSALANAAKAMQQRSEARECAAMAKAENDIARIEHAVETQKLRGALEELRFAIKQQVASGVHANRPSFQPQFGVRAF